MSSHSVIIHAQTVEETSGGVDYYAAWWQPMPGQSWQTITAVSWGATWFDPADALPIPPGPTRRRVTANDVEGELCLMDRKVWANIIRYYESGSVFEQGRPAYVYGAVMNSWPRITLGQWVNGIDGPRIVSVFGSDELDGFLARDGSCGSQSVLVAIARDFTPPATSIDLNLSIAVRGG